MTLYTSPTDAIPGSLARAAQLNNLDAAVTSAFATLDAALVLVSGFKNRPKFTYVDGDTITISGGSYNVNGIVAEITSEITTTAHGVTGADWAYLYIDYSSLSSGVALDQDNIIWSTTEPVWSHSLMGYYNGSDRCIFAVRIDGSDDILKFYHNETLVVFDEKIEVVNIATAVPTSFTDITAFTIPSFCKRVLTTFSYIWVDAGGELAWRTNGSSAATGHKCGRVGDTPGGESAIYSTVSTDVICDSSGIIEVDGAGTNTYGVYEDGFYLPEGI